VILSVVVVEEEDILDRRFEQPRNTDRSRLRGIVLVSLDRVDCLARQADSLAELGLRPVALGAQDLEPVPRLT
jgi:hypothetical protein